MAYLKYYREEEKNYPLYCKTIYKTSEEAEKVVKKLVRHFKLKNLEVRYKLKKDNGYANYCGITLAKKNISLRVICHEIGHHLAMKKTGQWGHNHKTRMKMNQVFKYAEKFLNCNCDNCGELCTDDICDINKIKIEKPIKEVCDDWRSNEDS